MNAHVIAMQETRLNEQGQHDMGKEMEENGWTLICGKPQPPLKRRAAAQTPYNARHGGVAIMSRGMQITKAPIDTDTRERLWNAGRWVHAMLPIGDGHRVMHIMSVWCSPGAEKNPEAMEK